MFYKKSGGQTESEMQEKWHTNKFTKSIYPVLSLLKLLFDVMS